MKKLLIIWIVSLTVSITFAENDVHFSEWGIPQWGSFHPYSTTEEFVKQTKLAGMDTLSPMFFPMGNGNIRSFINLLKKIKQADALMRIFPYMKYPEPSQSPANVEKFVHPKGYVRDNNHKTKFILHTFKKSASISDESFVKLICKQTEKMVRAISPYIVGLIWDEPSVSHDLNNLALASWQKYSGTKTFPKHVDKFFQRKDDIRKYMLVSPVYKKYFDWRTKTWIDWLERWAKTIHRVNPSLKVGINLDDNTLQPNKFEDITAVARMEDLDVIVRDPYFWGIPYLFETALLGNLAQKYNKRAGIFVGTSKSVADCFGPPEACVQPAIATANGCTEIFYYFCNQLKDPQVRPELTKGAKLAKQIKNFMNQFHAQKIGQIKLLYTPYFFEQSWNVQFGIAAKYSASIATLPLTVEELKDCKLLIIPSPTPFSQSDRAILNQATKSGLHLLCTHPEAVSYDERFSRIDAADVSALSHVIYLCPHLKNKNKRIRLKEQKRLEDKIDHLIKEQTEFSVTAKRSSACMVLPVQGQGEAFAAFAGRWFYSVDYLSDPDRTACGFLITNYSPSENVHLTIEWKKKRIKISVAPFSCKFVQNIKSIQGD